MSRLKELRQERADLTKEAKAMLDKAAEEKRDLNEAEATTFDAIQVKQAACAKALEREEWIIEQGKLLSTATDPREGSGIEVVTPKNRFKSFGEQLQAVKAAALAKQHGGQIDQRLIGALASGGSANVGSDGGFLIEEQFMPGIMKRAVETGVLWPRAVNIPIGAGADRLEYKEWDDYDQSAGTVYGGIQVYWRAEAEAVTAKKPAMTDGEIKLCDLMGTARLTGRQIEDAPSISALYEQGFGEAIAKALDRAVYNGNGVGKPLGIMNSGALVTVAKETGQSSDTLVAENFVNIYSRLPGSSIGSRGLVWIVCAEAQTQLPLMQIGTGASGQLVYMPPGGLTANPYGSIYGIPVVQFAGCKKLGDLGDVALIDMGQYLTISKGGMRTDWSAHIYFLTDEMAFRVIMRCNGQPMWKKALTPENAASGWKQSPFITLAAR